MAWSGGSTSSDDLFELGRELRFVGQLERANQMRPQAVSAPDPLHRTDAGGSHDFGSAMTIGHQSTIFARQMRFGHHRLKLAAVGTLNRMFVRLCIPQTRTRKS